MESVYSTREADKSELASFRPFPQIVKELAKRGSLGKGRETYSQRFDKARGNDPSYFDNAAGGVLWLLSVAGDRK